MFRLYIDIPFDATELEAIEVSKAIIKLLKQEEIPTAFEEVKSINYRLGNDEDRQKSNYLDKNENGHVSHRKLKF